MDHHTYTVLYSIGEGKIGERRIVAGSYVIRDDYALFFENTQLHGVIVASARKPVIVRREDAVPEQA